MPKTTWRVETKDGNQDYRLVVEVRPEESEDWIEGQYVWRGDIFLSTQGGIHLSEMILTEPGPEEAPQMRSIIPVDTMLDDRDDQETLESIARVCRDVVEKHEMDQRRTERNRRNTVRRLAELAAAGPRELGPGK